MEVLEARAIPEHVEEVRAVAELLMACLLRDLQVAVVQIQHCAEMQVVREPEQMVLMAPLLVLVA
jgi:hypothetical protein